MSRSAATPAAPPAPRFALASASLVYALASMALGWPALAGKFLVNTASDQYLAGYAFREFAANALRTTGKFPLWEPYLLGGMPYVSAMHGDIFYPTFLLRMIMPTDVAMTWSFILHVFLAGLFTYLFLRAWGLGFAPSLAGGLAYLMGGPIAAYVSPGHDGKLYVSALLPLALFLLVRGMRDGKRWSWGALAVVVGLAVLSPHPQLLQYLLLTAGAFALYLAFANTGTTKLDRRTGLTRLATAGGAVALGLAMGAVQYLPVIQYVPWSLRAGGLGGYDAATQFSFPPEELINTYLPQFSGILDSYTGRNFFHFHSEYLGVVVILLATLGVAAAGRGEKRRNFAWFWIGTFIASLLWALGGFTPFYRIVYALVPGTQFFRAPSTMMFVMAFATAVLAAFGVERVLEKKVSPRWVIAWAAMAAFVLLLGVTGAFTAIAANFAAQGQAARAMDNGPDIVLGAIRGFAFVAVALGVMLALIRQRLTPLAAGYALIALVGADLWSVERLYWRFSPPASVLYGGDSITDYLTKLDQPARVLAFPGGPGVAYHDPMLVGDGLMVHSIRGVLGYHGNELSHFDDLIDAGEGRRAVLEPTVWALLNVRYLLTNVPTSPVPGATPVLGPVTNAAGTVEYLYALPGANPYAWVATAIVKGADADVLRTVVNPQFKPYMAALFDTSAAVTAVRLTKMPDSTGIAVRVSRYEPGHVTLELSKPAPAGSALVVSENFYPGWIATVDGKPASLARADLTLIGVELPAGARAVELTFTSPPFQRGKLISLAALALAVLIAGAGAAMDQRSARG